MRDDSNLIQKKRIMDRMLRIYIPHAHKQIAKNIMIAETIIKVYTCVDFKF